MLEQFKRRLQAPVFPGNTDKTQQARRLNEILLECAFILLVIVLGIIPLFAVQKTITSIFAGTILAAILAGWAILQRGHVQRAAQVISGITWCCFLVMTLTSSGAPNPSMFFLGSSILLAALFLRGLFSPVLVLLSIAIGLSTFAAQSFGFTMPVLLVFTPLTAWLTFGLGLGLIARISGKLLQNLDFSLQREREHSAAREQAEAAARESQATLNAIMDSTGDLIWSVDAKTFGLLTFNAAFRDCFFQEHQVQIAAGMCPQELFPAQTEAEQWLEFYRHTLVAGHYAAEMANGMNHRILELNFNLLKHADDIFGISVFGKDITARKHAEQEREALLAQVTAARDESARTQQILSSVLERVSDGFVAFDAEFNYTYVNTHGGELLGRRAQDLIGKNYWTEYPEARGTPFADAYVRAMETQEPILLEDYYTHWNRWFVNRIYPSKEGITIFFSDITERKRAEIALRENSTFLSDLIENNGALIYVKDRAGKYELINRRWLETIGKTRAQTLGKTDSELFPGETGAYFHELDLEVMSSGELREHEEQVSDAHGTRYFLSLKFPLRAHDNSIRGICSISTEITARKHTEEHLRASEARFRALIDQAPVAISLARDGMGLYTNSKLVQLFGLPSAQAFTGSSMTQYFAPAAHIQAQERARRERDENTQTEYETIGIHRDGTEFPMQVSTSIVQLPDGPAELAFIHDLTEQKRAQQALSQAQEQFRAVVQTAHEAIITLDAQQNVVLWNAAAENIFGYSAVEMFGAPISRVIPSRHRARNQDIIATATAQGSNPSQSAIVELTALHRSGREFPAEMSVAEWRSHTGQYFTGIVRDISERKQHERELRAIAILGAALRRAESRAEMLPVILMQTLTLVRVQGAILQLYDAQTNVLKAELGWGEWAPFTGAVFELHHSVSGRVIKTAQPYISDNFKEDAELAYPKLIGELICVAGIPLKVHQQTIGALWVGRRTPIRESELPLLGSIADIAANAIHRATLHEQTKRAAAELQQAYDTTLEGWAHALELRDQETEGHTRRVTLMTLALARALGIQECEMENIRRGALLHDIGKMGIPDSVLLKPGTLNERELEIMRRHPEYAYNLLAPIEYLRAALDIPYCHHEKWDGTGYPRGLQGEAIPLAARIFSVVDVWDALTSDRPYRRAWSTAQALAYLRAQSGKYFDAHVLEVFLQDESIRM